MRIKHLVSVICLGICIPAQSREIAVISHPDANLTIQEPKQAAQIFLGKKKMLRDGTAIKIYDLPESDDRDSFYKRVTRKKSSQLHSYWARQLFSGVANPPEQLDSEEDMLKIVSSIKGAIGYIDASQVTENVKVLYTIDISSNK